MQEFYKLILILFQSCHHNRIKLLLTINIVQQYALILFLYRNCLRSNKERVQTII